MSLNELLVWILCEFNFEHKVELNVCYITRMNCRITSKDSSSCCNYWMKRQKAKQNSYLWCEIITFYMVAMSSVDEPVKIIGY